MDTERLSRTLSHALRHAPGDYGLELDDRGWGSLPALLEALRGRGSPWSGLSREDVERVLAAPGRRRFELDGDRIRALYGHSVSVRVDERDEAPPETLFHGTHGDAARRILEEGLRPMEREFVHLSPDRLTAREVGRRRTSDPVILEVRASAAHRSGVGFYRAGEQVWLADPVPARFVEGP